MKHFYAKAALQAAAPLEPEQCLSKAFLRERAGTHAACPTLDYKLGRDELNRAIARVTFSDDDGIKHIFEMRDLTLQNTLARKDLDTLDRKTLTMALHYLRTKDIAMAPARS